MIIYSECIAFLTGTVRDTTIVIKNYIPLLKNDMQNFYGGANHFTEGGQEGHIIFSKFFDFMFTNGSVIKTPKFCVVS